MNKSTVAVVGAGIIGVTLAYELTLSGYHVVLLDSAEGPSLGTSRANGAQLSYSYTDAMSSPALFAKMHAILMGLDPSFKIKPEWKFHFVRWGGRFIMNGLPTREEQNTRNLLNLSLHSRDRMHNAFKVHRVKFDYRPAGKLHIYSTEVNLARASKRAKLKTEWGCEQLVLNRQQCVDIEPHIGHLAKDIAGGIYSPLDEVGDCAQFALELLSLMRRQNTIQEKYSCKVNKILTNDRRVCGLETTQGMIVADHYALATGPESHYLVKDIGLCLPIYPVKGYSITVPATNQTPKVSLTDVDNKMVFCRIGNRLRVAGCADIVGFDRTLDETRIEHLLTVAKTKFPNAGDYNKILDRWSGFRPVTPSSAPIIGQAGPENFFLNIGHGMLGWTLAMGSASLLTAIIKEQELPIDAEGFRPKDHRISC